MSKNWRSKVSCCSRFILFTLLIFFSNNVFADQPTKSKYFGQIQNDIFEIMVKPRDRGALSTMASDVQKLPVKYSDSYANKELKNELDFILKSEYGLKDNFDARRLITMMHYMSAYIGYKYVGEYLKSIGYEDEGLTEKQKKYYSIYVKIKNGMSENAKKYDELLNYYKKIVKKSPNKKSILEFIKDYKLFLVQTYELARNKQELIDKENRKSLEQLRIMYKTILEKEYHGPKPKNICIDAAIGALQQTGFMTQFNSEACQYINTFHYKFRQTCNLKKTLEFIVEHPVTAMDSVIPIKNLELDKIIESVEPLRKSAEAALTGCKF